MGQDMSTAKPVNGSYLPLCNYLINCWPKCFKTVDFQILNEDS